MTVVSDSKSVLGSYDLVVVGAGIVGLASALAGVRRGMKVAVVERNAQAIGASVRNFGFVTVSGQRAGAHWRRAMQSRDVWLDVAPQAGIAVIHRGLYMPARRPEAVAVIEAFAQTEMGEHCRLLSRADMAAHDAVLQPAEAMLHSPHEIRVESREAIPKLAAWLQAAHGVDFFWQTAVQGIALPHIDTSRGQLRAAHAIVCPGNDTHSLFPQHIAQAKARQCTLQMLRVKPPAGYRLPGAVMSDLSLARYEGFASLPAAQALRARLQAEQGEYLAAGIHLIAVQSADGSLVVGDSHVYGDAEAPFASAEVDTLMLAEMHRVLRVPGAEVSERWTGSYVSSDEVVFATSPQRGVALGMVTGGTGASTGFAFGQEMLDLACHSENQSLDLSAKTAVAHA